MLASLVGGGIGLLAGLLGAGLQGGIGAAAGIYGANASERSNDLNREESKRQFDANLAWQREQFDRLVQLSNTAHQREVDDLRAAGLNPVLSATGGSGASVPSSVGAAPATAHASDLDLSGSMRVISDSIADASDQALKAADLNSLISLREAQAAEALSNASKNDKLSPAMESDFLQRANASAASAKYHNSLATSNDYLTPLQGALLREQALREQNTARGVAKENRWIDRKYQWKLMTDAAKRDFLAGQLKINQVNAARGIYNSIRDTLRPRGFRLENNNSSGQDFLGDLIFNK